MSGVQLDIMLLVPEITIIGILTVPHVRMDHLIRIIPVIRHHRQCMRWKATVHGRVMRITINLVRRVYHVRLCRILTVVRTPKQ